MVAKETDKRRQLLSIVCTIFYLTAFFYPGPRSFHWKFSPRERERERERERRLGGSGLDLQFQFREDDSCQTRQSEQWQFKHVLISRYFFSAGVDRKNTSRVAYEKGFKFVARWDFRPQKTSTRILRSKCLRTTFMSIWSSPCSRAYYMHYTCSILQTIFLK